DRPASSGARRAADFAPGGGLVEGPRAVCRAGATAFRHDRADNAFDVAGLSSSDLVLPADRGLSVLVARNPFTRDTRHAESRFAGNIKACGRGTFRVVRGRIGASNSALESNDALCENGADALQAFIRRQGAS